MTHIVFEQHDKIVMQKLSSLPTQSSVEEFLNKFVSSEVAEVCLLLANMEETSLRTINHIRVMIEEAEVVLHNQQCKLFVVLLHFPPTQFSQHHYPILFLKGWDHTYLDTITHSNDKCVVDLHDWLSRCCFPAKELKANHSDTLLQNLHHFLPQTISIICARVCFGKKDDSSFNSTMNAVDRRKALWTLLFDKGLGDILCIKFRAYWTPKVMMEYLKSAAIHSKQREFAVSITDFIHTQVMAFFTDFCVYILSKANENFNLDIAYAAELDNPTHKLFLDLFKSLPVPELSELSLKSNNLSPLQSSVQHPQFPFFTHVYSLMEKQVELTSESANLRLDFYTHRSYSINSSSPTNLDAKLNDLVNDVLADLNLQLKVSIHRLSVL